jgi:uncharacterized protein
MKLSDGEKLIILMLTDMYKAMKLKGEFDPEFISATIHGDHLWGFDWEYQGIPFERSPTPPDVTETVDVLDMWSLIESAYAALTPANKAKLEKEAGVFGKNVRFHGFDGNNEPHYHIARYMIDDMRDRFEHFKGRDLNSHSPSIDAYRRMYAVFEPVRSNLHDRNLSVDELIAILNAAIHPSNR